MGKPVLVIEKIEGPITPLMEKIGFKIYREGLTSEPVTLDQEFISDILDDYVGIFHIPNVLIKAKLCEFLFKKSGGSSDTPPNTIASFFFRLGFLDDDIVDNLMDTTIRCIFIGSYMKYYFETNKKMPEVFLNKFRDGIDDEDGELLGFIREKYPCMIDFKPLDPIESLFTFINSSRDAYAYYNNDAMRMEEMLGNINDLFNNN